MGDSKTPFYFLAVSSIAKIAVDILFVKSLHMGVAGVALATFLCQGISCVLAMIAVFKRLNCIGTKEKIPFFDKGLLKEIAAIASQVHSSKVLYPWAMGIKAMWQ